MIDSNDLWTQFFESVQFIWIMIESVTRLWDNFGCCYGKMNLQAGFVFLIYQLGWEYNILVQLQNPLLWIKL